VKSKLLKSLHPVAIMPPARIDIQVRTNNTLDGRIRDLGSKHL